MNYFALSFPICSKTSEEFPSSFLHSLTFNVPFFTAACYEHIIEFLLNPEKILTQNRAFVLEKI